MKRRTLTVVIAVVVVAAVVGAGTYYFLTRPTSSCALKTKNPLIYDQPEPPDSMDPAVTFSTPGWAAVEQVYQSLVMYNGSSYTDFVGELAKNWSTSSDGFHWNFTLWPGATFSDGHPVNAYVMWFSLYRSLVMNQGPAFILGQNFGINGSWKALQDQLNGFNFLQPNASEKAAMSAPGLAFRALDAVTFQVNLGTGYLGPVAYHYLLPTLVAPVSSAVDPVVVHSNGGVVANTTNQYLGVNMVGSGPYQLVGSYDPAATSFTLAPSTHYWESSIAAARPWNSMIQPANASVQTNLQKESSLIVSNLRSGSVAGASFTYIGPSTLAELKGISCVVVTPMPVVYGSTAGGWWIYMNQSQPPFNNLTVREAVVHAIDYPTIIQRAFGGYATPWVGPVPPSYPYYNPQNLAPYDYNLTLAKQLMSHSPWPNGYPGTLKYAYLNLGAWQDVATIIQSDLAKIGITIQALPIELTTLYQNQRIGSNGKCIGQDPAHGGPYPIGQEFYTSDYIAPDDWTQNNALGTGSANQCMSGYSNATVNTLVVGAAGESRAANLTADYSTMTRLMYYNYTDAWLVVPTTFQVYNSAVHGIIANPMGSALPFVMLYNTQYAR